MNFLKLNVDDVVPNDYNPNKMSAQEYNQLLYMIEQYGQVLPILVQPKNSENKYVIIDGENRHKALIEKGITEIYAIIAKEQTDIENYHKLTVGLNLTGGTSTQEDLAMLFNKEIADAFMDIFKIPTLNDLNDKSQGNPLFSKFNKDWEDSNVWEEDDISNEHMTIQGTKEELSAIRTFIEALKDNDPKGLQKMWELVSKREIDEDESFFMFYMLAVKRALTQRNMAFKKNPSKPFSLVLRGTDEVISNVLDSYWAAISERRKK